MRNRGGKRANSGPKKGHPTGTLAVRARLVIVDMFKRKYKHGYGKRLVQLIENDLDEMSDKK